MSASTLRPTAHGHSFPIGATVLSEGVNFSVFSKHAQHVELCLFESADAPAPSDVLVLDAERNRTYHYWHLFVPGLKAGQHYAYRVDGPRQPSEGLLFDGAKALLDPYGRGVAYPKAFSRAAAMRAGDNAAQAMRSVVVNPRAYDWGNDEPPRTPFRRTVVYELHVRGFTRHPSSGLGDDLAGTFAGLTRKIPHLVDLGITAVELMPVFAYDPQDAPAELVNYWGYSPVSFFAVHPFYSAAYRATNNALAAVDEFRDMVKALHEAGIEVILDVVYNHTAEGGPDGPMYSWRGFANRGYYLLDPADRSKYRDYTGCGNTLRSNHPVSRRMILDSLRWWVREMHVDGFRFDLASILTRDETGHPVENPPAIWDIESDPVLCNVKLIAEAWDAAGLYQVGSFVGDSWKEWNGRFRDDVRRFVHGEPGSARTLPPRLVASPDLYEHEHAEPEQSVNFITCHDGFTLNDLVSYSRKHNEANNEGNKDGSDWNHSNNHGVEGPTDDPAVEALRLRQIRNFLVLTLVSMGTPMLLMGDECRRTQGGNNNAWCHDNETTWLDWSLMERHRDLVRFVRELVRMRSRQRPRLAPGMTLREILQHADLKWHGVALNHPDWGDASHSLAMEARRAVDGMHAYLAMNAYTEALSFELPPCVHGWRRMIDTALTPPEDLEPGPELPRISNSHYLVQPQTVVLLVAPPIP